MHYSPTMQHPTRRQQNGAALFMALVVLLVLTILGVFGMNISRLENLMAGNTQFQTTALNNTEYVLVRGEQDIQAVAAGGGNPFNPDVSTDHYYPAGTTGTTRPEDLNWAFNTVKVSLPDINADGSDTDGDGTPDDGTGMYVIEDAGTDSNEGEMQDVGSTIMEEGLAGAMVQAFLVSAQSSSSKGARRIVQSVVITDPLTP